MPRVRFLELREQLLRIRQDHEEQAQSIARGRARIESVEQQRRHLQAEFRNGLRREQLEVEERIATLEQELVKARQRRERMTLRAPVAGAVQEMTVFTEGGVVRAGEPVMSVVPSGSTLIVEARLLNKDVGFVRPGQPASVKLAAFPFTRYGDIAGRVEGISEDVLSRGRQPPRARARRRRRNPAGIGRPASADGGEQLPRPRRPRYPGHAACRRHRSARRRHDRHRRHHHRPAAGNRLSALAPRALPHAEPAREMNDSSSVHMELHRS